MKRLIATSLCLSFLQFLVFAQDGAELFLDNNKLTGSCHNPYFTAFEIELDSAYKRIDSITLFKQLPRLGILNFKNKTNISTEYTLTNRAGYAQIMFRFKSNWYTFDNLKISHKSISFSIDTDPIIPGTLGDLEIVKLTKKILSEEKYWNRVDDRQCVDDIANKSYSLYCALRIASLQVEEKYNHRNASLQSLRHIIQEKYPNRKWKHRLMDFNNMEETTYHVIMKTLDLIEHQFEEDINSRNSNGK